MAMAEKKKNGTVKVRLSTADRRVLERAARREGLPLSTYLRKAAVDHAGEPEKYERFIRDVAGSWSERKK